MPSNSYDLVVLGDDLAALACAAICARRGLRTLVLGDERPARYQLGPHKLPVDPLVWSAPASGAPSGAERVLTDLHAAHALRRKLREPRLAAQLVAPDLRIDLGADRLAGELVRELGDAGAATWLAQWDRASELARLLDALVAGEHAFPGVGFFERREVAKLTERATAEAEAWWASLADDPRRALWQHLAAIAVRHPAPSALEVARVLDAWRAGPLPIRGDGDALRELFLEKLTTAGGELRAGRVTEIGVSWGKIASLTLTSGDELGCGQVVSSRPAAELVPVLGKKAPKRLTELAEALAIVGYRYTLNIVVDEAGLPEHLAPTVAVAAAPDQAPSGDGAFSLHVGEPDDTGRVIVSVAAVLASDGALDLERTPSRCMALRAGLWARLGEVMPFFERHLVLAHSPFEATSPQVPGGRGSYDVPRNLPLPMTPVWKAGDAGYTTGLKNLTLTGDQVQPALGLEGALVTGWSAAKVACAIAGKKKDYLRDEVVGTSG